MELTWTQFKELLNVLITLSQAKANGIDSGEFSNDNVSAEWNDNGVEFTIGE